MHNNFFVYFLVSAKFDLKGHCQEEFAVLGQFCAEIITLKLFHKQIASVKL